MFDESGISALIRPIIQFLSKGSDKIEERFGLNFQISSFRIRI